MKPRVIIEVYGGLVTEVHANVDLDCDILDHDNAEDPEHEDQEYDDKLVAELLTGELFPGWTHRQGREPDRAKIEAATRLIEHAEELLAVCEEIASDRCDLLRSERRCRLYGAILRAGGSIDGPTTGQDGGAA
jgi:hypothetical protein